VPPYRSSSTTPLPSNKTILDRITAEGNAQFEFLRPSLAQNS